MAGILLDGTSTIAQDSYRQQYSDLLVPFPQHSNPAQHPCIPNEPFVTLGHPLILTQHLGPPSIQCTALPTEGPQHIRPRCHCC